MTVTRISRYFKDISLSFEPHPVTKDLPILMNRNAISRSIRNLVETIKTERVFNSTIGSSIVNSLFDFVDYGTASIVQDEIIIAIKNYEPRVEDVLVQVNPNPDQNNFDVIVTYNIIGQEIPTQQFSFILEATR
jgi:phage baseplate assembly protein W